MTMTEPVERTLTARDPRLEPWRQFLMAHARVSRRLDEELRADHDLSLAEYDALLTIAQAPGRRIRMRHLADRVILSKSGVTRLIDRLVARRPGRAQRLRDRRPRRGGRPDHDRPRPPARRVADPPARHRATTSSRPSTPADLPVLERAMRRWRIAAGPGGEPDRCSSIDRAIDSSGARHHR